MLHPSHLLCDNYITSSIQKYAVLSHFGGKKAAYFLWQWLDILGGTVRGGEYTEMIFFFLWKKELNWPVFYKYNIIISLFVICTFMREVKKKWQILWQINCCRIFCTGSERKDWRCCNRRDLRCHEGKSTIWWAKICRCIRKNGTAVYWLWRYTWNSDRMELMVYK